MRIRASLKDLYVGKTIKMTRVLGVFEKTSGTRQCKCRMRTITKQLGPGMFQQMQRQVRLTCPCCNIE
jgi:DnaJ homolog subfamily B member 11